MICPKCKKGELAVYKTVSGPLFKFQYTKCLRCDHREKTVTLPFSLLEEAGIADTRTLEARLRYIRNADNFEKKLRLSTTEIVYGKSKK